MKTCQPHDHHNYSSNSKLHICHCHRESVHLQHLFSTIGGNVRESEEKKGLVVVMKSGTTGHMDYLDHIAERLEQAGEVMNTHNIHNVLDCTFGQ